VTLVNERDDEVLPPDFRFINHVVLGDGVERAGDSFRSGCSCKHDRNCQYTVCLCLADLDDDDDDEYEGPDASYMDLDEFKARKAYAYHAHGTKAELLRTKYHNSKKPIYECHQGCACSFECPNRVVERGRTVPLQIFRTKDRGWGM
jgi:[histone H3]-lysine9 N-trimethyltransferase SUV39H